MGGDARPARARAPTPAGRREVPPEALDRLRQVVERTRPLNLAEERLLPLTAATEHLLPGGGLIRGSVVTLGGGAGATTLALALVAGPCRTGSWVAFVGFPELGWEAAEEVGLRLDRLVSVHAPSRGWARVVAALVDAFDVVLCGPDVVPAPAELRNLRARARERGSVLVGVGGTVPGPGGSVLGRPGRAWPSGDVRLRVVRSRWQGLGEGWGRLGRRHLDVVVEGRGELSRPRRHEVVLDARGRPVASGPPGRRGLHTVPPAGLGATMGRAG